MSFFQQAPYSIPTEYKDNKQVAFVGFSILILKEIQNRMNFTWVHSFNIVSLKLMLFLPFRLLLFHYKRCSLQATKFSFKCTPCSTQIKRKKRYTDFTQNFKV